MKPKIKIKVKPKVSAKGDDEGIHSWKDAAVEAGVIGAGSLGGAAAYDGIKHAVKATQAPLPNQLAKEKKRNFSWKGKAGWVGTIAAGDVLGEGAHDALTHKRKKKVNVKKGIETTSAIPGNTPSTLGRIDALTLFIKKPDPYIIRRATLRGKKPPGVPKIKKFEDERKTTNLNPEKKNAHGKSETFRNVAVGSGALLSGAGVAHAGRKIGKAADIAEKLQKHVGGLATSTHDKVNAHIDYIGHHAGEAAEESTRAARAARKTASGYHPRALAKTIGSKLKKVPGLKRFLSNIVPLTELHVMKERHPKGEEDKESFLKRHGARIAGTAAGVAGTALFFKHFKPIKSGVAKTKGKARISKKPGEKKIRRKPEPVPITNIREVKRKKRNLAAISRSTNFEEFPRDRDNQFAPIDKLVPSYRKAKKIVTVGKRGGDVAEDLRRVARGEKRDPKKKPFWEKAWFQTGALALAGGVAIRSHRKHAKEGNYKPYFSARIPLINFAFMIHDPDFPITPMKKLPVRPGAKHRVPVAETRQEVIDRLKATTALARRERLIAFAKGIKIRRGPFRISRNAAYGEYKVSPQIKGDAKTREAQSYYTSDKQDARDTAAHMIRSRRSTDRAKVKTYSEWKAKKAASFSRQFASNGAGRVAAETLIDATTIGADIGPKKKKPTKAQIAAKNADPDLTPTNNWTADPQAPLAKLEHRVPLIAFAMKLPPGIPVTKPTPRGYNRGGDRPVDDKRGLSTARTLDKFIKGKQLARAGRKTEFYGTSAGVTASWDTRGRSQDKPKTAHWWTHSPTKNSVRVVRSHSEEGPRTRRGKKFHERTSTHKAAIAATSVAAAGLGALAINRHLKFKTLDKAVHRPGRVVAVSTPRAKGRQPHYRDVTPKRPRQQESPTPSRQGVKKKTEFSYDPAEKRDGKGKWSKSAVGVPGKKRKKQKKKGFWRRYGFLIRSVGVTAAYFILISSLKRRAQQRTKREFEEFFRRFDEDMARRREQARQNAYRAGQDWGRSQRRSNPMTGQWHKILQVPANSTFEVTRSAYLKMVKKHHPDVGGSNEEMKVINAAWAEAKAERGWT